MKDEKLPNHLKYKSITWLFNGNDPIEIVSESAEKPHIMHAVIKSKEGDIKVIIKHYNTPSNYSRDSLQNELNGYAIANKVGALTPIVFGYGKDINGTDFVIIQELEYAEHLHDVLFYASTESEKIIRNLAKSLFKIFLGGLLHCDTDSINILVRGSDVFFIDFAQSKSIDPETNRFPLREVFFAIASCNNHYLTTHEYIEWAKQIALDELKELGADVEDK